MCNDTNTYNFKLADKYKDFAKYKKLEFYLILLGCRDIYDLFRDDTYVYNTRHTIYKILKDIALKNNI